MKNSEIYLRAMEIVFDRDCGCYSAIFYVRTTVKARRAADELFASFFTPTYWYEYPIDTEFRLLALGLMSEIAKDAERKAK